MVSNNYINECKNRANGNRLGKIIVNGIETPITNSDNLQSFSIDSGCYVDGNIIGSIYIKCLNGKFISVPDNVELIDKIIHAQIGVKYSDNTTEYINMGKYTIERPNDEKTANMSQIKAYDYLINKIDNKYVCDIDYSSPKTLSDLYIDLCNQLELTPVTTIFLNSDIPIISNPFTNGEKNRLVLQTILKIACSFATIDSDNDEIDLSWISNNEEPDYTFEMNDYATLEGGTIQYGPINSVTIKNSEIDDENVTQKDQGSISQFGEHSIVISEDYILYDASLRQRAITAIFNRLNGFKYIDSNLTTYYGKPFLKIGDKIRIKTGTEPNDYFETYVLIHTFTYDGTFQSNIKSPALTDQEIKTKQDITLAEALRNTQIKVDKQNGNIELLTTRTDSINETLANDYYTTEQTNQLIQTAETGLTNKLVSVGGNNLWKNTYFSEFENSALTYWNGNLSNVSESDSASRTAGILPNGIVYQTISLPNGTYTNKFKYKKLISTATCLVKYNNKTIELTGEIGEEQEIETTGDVTTNSITIEFDCDTIGGFEFYELMLNAGSEASVFSQGVNETISDTVNIGKGIQVENNTINSYTRLDADGLRGYNKQTQENTFYQTDDGMYGKKLTTESIQSGNLIISTRGKHNFISGL